MASDSVQITITYHIIYRYKFHSSLTQNVSKHGNGILAEQYVDRFYFFLHVGLRIKEHNSTKIYVLDIKYIGYFGKYAIVVELQKCLYNIY